MVTKSRTVHAVTTTADYIYGVNSKNQTVAVPVSFLIGGEAVENNGGAGDSDGTTGNGTDNAAAFAAAAAGGDVVKLPAGIFRLASEVQFTGPTRIIGQKPAITKTGELLGTWVYFDHADRGFYFRDGVSDKNYFAAVENIGIIRNQPAAGVAWAPTAAGYDIQADTPYIELRNIFPLRSTKFALLRNAASMTVDGIRGQVFDEGIKVERTADVPRLSNIHWWPYWSQDTNVTGYQTDNLKGLIFERADNPIVTDYFNIYAKYGFYFNETASGTTSKFGATNVTFDQTDFGFYVAAGTNITGKVTNMHHQAPAAVGRTTGRAIDIQGDSCLLEFVSVESGRSVQEVLNIDGESNNVRVSMMRCSGWASGGGGENTFRLGGAGAANKLTFTDVPVAYTSSYGAETTPSYNVTSTTHQLIRSGEVRSTWTPAIGFSTAGDAAVTYSLRQGYATRNGRLVVAHFNVVTSAFTHTTASGNLRLSGLPFTSASITDLECHGAVEWSGVTKAGYTDVAAVLVESATILTFRACGSGVATSNVVAADMPTGGTVRLRGTVTYMID